MGWDPHDYGPNLALPRHSTPPTSILQVNVVTGPSMLRREDAVPPVRNDVHVDEGGGTDAFPPDLDVMSGIVSQGVVADPWPGSS
jgi:hypothetical protein